MPVGLEETGWEDERNQRRAAVLRRPPGGRHGPLWRDRQSHLWANAGKSSHPNAVGSNVSRVLFLNPVHVSLLSSVWEERLLRGRPRGDHEAARSLANAHAPDPTLLCCAVQQQPHRHRGPGRSGHRIHLHQQGTRSPTSVSSKIPQLTRVCCTFSNAHPVMHFIWAATSKLMWFNIAWWVQYYCVCLHKLEIDTQSPPSGQCSSVPIISAASSSVNGVSVRAGAGAEPRHPLWRHHLQRRLQTSFPDQTRC